MFNHSRKNWWLFIIWFLLLLAVASLWVGTYWFLDQHIDLFTNANISVLKYDVILGPLFIGPITELWYYPILGSGIFLLNNLILLLIKNFDRFYKALLIVSTFIIMLLINIALYVLLITNLK